MRAHLPPASYRRLVLSGAEGRPAGSLNLWLMFPRLPRRLPALSDLVKGAVNAFASRPILCASRVGIGGSAGFQPRENPEEKNPASAAAILIVGAQQRGLPGRRLVEPGRSGVPGKHPWRDTAHPPRTPPACPERSRRASRRIWGSAGGATDLSPARQGWEINKPGSERRRRDTSQT